MINTGLLSLDALQRQYWTVANAHRWLRLRLQLLLLRWRRLLWLCPVVRSDVAAPAAAARAACAAAAAADAGDADVAVVRRCVALCVRMRGVERGW